LLRSDLRCWRSGKLWKCFYDMESEHIPCLLVRNFSKILQMVTVGQKQLFKRLLFQLFALSCA
jgi:hypothetical protein